MKIVTLILRWVLLAAAVVLATWVTPDVDLRGGLLSALVVAALIAAANVVAQSALRLLPTPDNLLVLIVLTLAVNGCAVWLASAFTARLHIDGFVAAITFALMVTVFSVALGGQVAKFLYRYERTGVDETA